MVVGRLLKTLFGMVANADTSEVGRERWRGGGGQQSGAVKSLKISELMGDTQEGVLSNLLWHIPL